MYDGPLGKIYELSSEGNLLDLSLSPVSFCRVECALRVSSLFCLPLYDTILILEALGSFLKNQGVSSLIRGFSFRGVALLPIPALLHRNSRALASAPLTTAGTGQALH